MRKKKVDGGSIKFYTRLLSIVSYCYVREAALLEGVQNKQKMH